MLDDGLFSPLIDVTMRQVLLGEAGCCLGQASEIHPESRFGRLCFWKVKRWWDPSIASQSVHFVAVDCAGYAFAM
ncbi:hypothetical protein OAE79_00145 [Rhodopirellula sp.]|nr:hypothetical protein [Rhodopirellula sp.]MDB4678722.1 hypothetical protein [Rhodopirellula sp.]